MAFLQSRPCLGYNSSSLSRSLKQLKETLFEFANTAHLFPWYCHSIMVTEANNALKKMQSIFSFSERGWPNVWQNLLRLTKWDDVQFQPQNNTEEWMICHFSWGRTFESSSSFFISKLIINRNCNLPDLYTSRYLYI